MSSDKARVENAVLQGSVSQAALMRLTKAQLVDMIEWLGYGIDTFEVKA